MSGGGGGLGSGGVFEVSGPFDKCVALVADILVVYKSVIDLSCGVGEGFQLGGSN